MFATLKNLDLILTHLLLPTARTGGAHLPSSCRGATASGWRRAAAELPRLGVHGLRDTRASFEDRPSRGGRCEDEVEVGATTGGCRWRSASLAGSAGTSFGVTSRPGKYRIIA
jgi:hypothetical protein